MRTIKFIKINLNRFPEVSWKIIVSAVFLHIIYSSFINLVIFPSGLFKSVHIFTGGVLQVTLIVNLIGLALIIGGVILFAGKQRARALGLNLNKVPQALITVLILWLSVQIIEGIMNLAIGGVPTVNPDWQQKGVLTVIGAILAQVLGNALFEEALFRGFLLTQIYLKFKNNIFNEKKSLFLALITTQGLFALSHIPNRIFMGVGIGEIFLNHLPMLFMLGLVFSLIYHRTDNLFIAVGIHSLMNIPASIFNGYGFTPLWYYVLTAVLLIFWSRIIRTPSEELSNSISQDG